jgi:hypothetical protein
MKKRTVYLDYGLDGSLLYSGRLLKAVRIDTTDEILSQAHAVECRDNLQTEQKVQPRSVMEREY